MKFILFYIKAIIKLLVKLIYTYFNWEIKLKKLKMEYLS